jgi:hypothetical protein
MFVYEGKLDKRTSKNVASLTHGCAGRNLNFVGSSRPVVLDRQIAVTRGRSSDRQQELVDLT